MTRRADERRTSITISRVQAIIGVTIAVLSLFGLLAANYRQWRGHVADDILRQQREAALCGRLEQVAATVVKYYPLETSALYYPGAKECP